jgi:hypothetical protein
MKCYIFDIDGTLANADHRLHHIQKTPKDWDSFFGAQYLDREHRHIVGVALLLAMTTKIVFCSGRPETYRETTRAWLNRSGFDPESPLYMRPANDRRDDDIIKSELLDRIILDGFDPIMAFDDRDRVVAMWRARGVPCAQVAPGNF